jgi:D-alanyl-lipoteichoic acid acyltransferase DltB (MBOAT superfamily)
MISGLRLILFGLFKTTVVSGILSGHIDTLFGRIGHMYGIPYFLGTYLYFIQLYADFSGITDIAIGLGRLFGINSPRNFNAPFFAPNVQEFWRRWHITLTSWLSDYLYKPLSLLVPDTACSV